MSRRNILSLLFLLLNFALLSAQTRTLVDSMSVKVYFMRDYSRFDLSYADNSASVALFINQLDSIQQDPQYEIKSVHINGFTSPDGSYKCNQRLAVKRANKVIERLNMMMPDSEYDFHKGTEHGIDWKTLKHQVDTSDIHGRDEILDIITNVPEVVYGFKGGIVDSRHRHLRMLYGGQPYRFMYDNFFPELISAVLTVVYEVDPLDMPDLPEPKISRLLDRPQEKLPYTLSPAWNIEKMRQQEESASAKRSLARQMSQKSGVRTTDHPFFLGFRTNLLFDAALVPNVGAEFHIKDGWTIGATYMHAWWAVDPSKFYWRTYGGELYGRKYFGAKAAEKPLTGHHAGIYAQILTYDFEAGGPGQMSYLTYGAGLEYGYTLPVARKFNIDFSIGLGYLGGKYMDYTPIDDHYVWLKTSKRNLIGPTKAEVTLVWLIGRDNYNRKGGRR